MIELIISSALMTIILVSGYVCLRAGVEGQILIESRGDSVQRARVALALMAADLRAAVPLSQEFQFLGVQRTIGEFEADNIDFATLNYKPRGPHESEVCNVSYYLERHPETGELNLWRGRDATFDAEPLAEGTREEIADRIRGLRFEYYDGWDWYTTWGEVAPRPRGELAELLQPNLFGMPEAVRITLFVEPDSRTGRAEAGLKREREAEPPLVFQTVVRLNLANVSWTWPVREQAGAGL